MITIKERQNVTCNKSTNVFCGDSLSTSVVAATTVYNWQTPFLLELGAAGLEQIAQTPSSRKWPRTAEDRYKVVHLLAHQKRLDNSQQSHHKNQLP